MQSLYPDDRAEPSIPCHDGSALPFAQDNGAPVGVGKVSDADKQDVGRFLNRMLGLDPEWQARLFDFFQAMLEYVVAEARREGRYQDGIVDVKATSVVLKEQPQVRSILAMAVKLLILSAMYTGFSSLNHFLEHLQ